MSELDTLMNFADTMSNQEVFQPLNQMIENIMAMDDSALTDQSVESIIGAVNGAFTQNLRDNMVKQTISDFEERGFTRARAKQEYDNLVNAVDEIIQSLTPTAHKEKLLRTAFNLICETIGAACEAFHNFDITLPIQLEEGAKVPTYAHDTDAAADLYAADTVVVPAHTYGNMIRTGVHIGLPEGWVAYILPRSSIGAKTPLRLSNFEGVIDAGYRGPLGVLYDNTSDSDYTINAGDRIAQLIIMPSYHFKAKVVDALDETDRNSGGFGSTGK